MVYFGTNHLGKSQISQDYRHDCLLTKKEEIMVRYIDEGYFVPFRRRFRTLLMVCETNPLSKKYLKSSAAIRLEKTRHLYYYYYMIHPFSNGRIYWEMFMMIVLSLLFIVIPIDICVNDRYLIISKIILDSFNIIDIVLTFWTGYLKENTHKIVMDKKSVAKNYIFGLFIFDVLTSFNVFITLYQTFTIKTGDKTIFVYVKMINYLKILRVFTWMRYLERFRQWKQYNLYKFKIANLVLYYIFTIWWYGCILYMMHNFLNDESSVYTNIGLNYSMLFKFLYCAVYMIFLIGSGDDTNYKRSDLFFDTVILISGYLMHIYTISQVIHIVNKYNSSSNKYSQMIQQLQEFIRTKNIPDFISKRILTYFDFRYKKNYFKEHDILGTLSKNLRQEIFLHQCTKHLDNAQIFKDVPQSLVTRLTSSMKSEIYLANDLIVQAGTRGTSMYFIHSGTVAVYTPYGREVCHLSEGASFGEIALILDNEERAASVIAIDTIELFSLSNKDFIKCIEPFPNLYEAMRICAEDRLRVVMMCEIADEDNDEMGATGHNRGTTGIDEFTIVKDRSKTRMHYHI